jgi:exonuclease SbcC
LKIIQKWLRPKWQHPDASVRLKALANTAIELDVCRQLAVSDPDAAVREQAINKLDSVEQLLDVLRVQPATQEAVAARLTILLLQAPAATIEPHLPQALATISKASGLEQLASQAADIEIRAAAVGLVADPVTLRHCALEDKAAEVRVRAVGLIDDEDALHEIERSAKGRDKTVARLAAQRLSELRARHERTAELGQLLDELQHLSETPDLDAEALHRVRARWKSLEADAEAVQLERYALLAPRLETRLAILHKTQQDDLSHKMERERLVAQLRQLTADLASADPDEARAALKIIRAGWEQVPPLQDRWTGRRLQEEWQEAAEAFESRLRNRERAASQEHAIATAIAECEGILQRGPLHAKQIEVARQRWSDLSRNHAEDPALQKPLQRLHELVDRMADRMAHEQDALKTVQRKLKDAVDALESALEQKQLDPAMAAHKMASTILAEGGQRPELRTLQRRLAKCEPTLRELQSWRNWGSDKAREELVDEARQLVDADIGIEERVQTLKGLRARWKALGGGGPKARRLWETFDAACSAAHEPIKQDRRDQAEQREQNLAVRTEICTKLERLAANTDWSAPDWRAVDRELSQAKRLWRAAGGVPHKTWETIRQRFDRAIDRVEQHLSKERRHNFLQRQALANEAQALAEQTDLRQAVAEARRLREAWQVTAPSARRDEQGLWKVFNAALDDVFDRGRAARDQFNTDLEEQRQKAEALCIEMEGLIRAEDPEIRTLRAELSRLSAAFGQLGPLPRNARQGLDKRFRQASHKLQEHIAAIESADEQQALAEYHTLHSICERAEALAQSALADEGTTATLDAAWRANAKPGNHKNLLGALEERFAQAMAVLAGKTPAPDPQTLARNAVVRNNICLDLEILRKQDSPQDCQTERLQRQVALLEATMQGADEPRDRKVRDLRIDYLRQGPVPSDQQQALAERFGRLFP